MNSSKKACCAVETVLSGTVLSGRRSHVIHEDQQPPALLLRGRCADTKALTTNYMLHIHPTNPPVLPRHHINLSTKKIRGNELNIPQTWNRWINYNYNGPIDIRYNNT